MILHCVTLYMKFLPTCMAKRFAPRHNKLLTRKLFHPLHRVTFFGSELVDDDGVDVHLLFITTIGQHFTFPVQTPTALECIKHLEPRVSVSLERLFFIF